MVIKGHLTAQITSKSPYVLSTSIGSHVSGNAHGAIFGADLGLYNGKNAFFLGACVQKRSMTLSGASFNYMRILTGKEDHSSVGPDYPYNDSKLQLFFYSRLVYLNNTSLSFNDVKKEETLIKKQSETPSKYDEIKLSTAEISVGVGLNFKLSKNIVWANYIGFGTYYHLNYKPGMYTDKAAPMLVIGTSLKLNSFHR